MLAPSAHPIGFYPLHAWLRAQQQPEGTRALTSSLEGPSSGVPLGVQLPVGLLMLWPGKCPYRGMGYPRPCLRSPDYSPLPAAPVQTCQPVFVAGKSTLPVIPHGRGAGGGPRQVVNGPGGPSVP